MTTVCKDLTRQFAVQQFLARSAEAVRRQRRA